MVTLTDRNPDYQFHLTLPIQAVNGSSGSSGLYQTGDGHQPQIIFL